MEHVSILYYLAALGVGLFSLGCIFAIQRGNKNEIIRMFLYCYGLFCLFILSAGIKAYIDLLTAGQSRYIAGISNSVQFFGLIFSMYLLTFLINKIHLVPFSKKANIVLFVFAALIWSFCALRDNGVLYIPQKPYLGIIDDELFYSVMILYNFCVYLIFRKNIEDKRLYKVLRMTFFISMMFIPGFIFDEIISQDGRILVFTPSFFIIVSIISVYSFFRYSESVQSEKYQISDDIRKKFGITERETEVAKLLLKGYSYKKIADELVISLSTVRAHVSNIYKKASVNSRYELYNLINT